MIQTNFSLLHHNTFGVDVKANKFIEYSSVDELNTLILDGQITPPFLHIGQGSNLLFTKDFDGTILHSRIGKIEIANEDVNSVWVKAGAGIDWDHFVAYCVDQNWYGLENLSLIPGEVGASAVQNIGAYGVEVKDLIASVETIDIFGEKRVYDVSECKYSYRNSIFKQADMKNVFVTHVIYKLSKNRGFTLTYAALKDEMDSEQELTLSTVRNAVISIRKRKLPDPKVLGNAGSFFMNPIVSKIRFEELSQQYPGMPYYQLPDGTAKIPAGWLIEQAGWKGKSLGDAAVYENQALVLVNKGGATGGDILHLSDAVRQSVLTKFDIDIKPEVNII